MHFSELWQNNNVPEKEIDEYYNKILDASYLYNVYVKNNK